MLPSFSLTNYLTNVVVGAQSFPKGLVFDSRVFTPLSSVPPVQFNDSGACQHMAVIKDFQVPVGSTNLPDTAPEITDQPDNLSVPQGANATFTVGATGSAPLAYQWRFNGTNLAGATAGTYTRLNVQAADAGSYTVVITNVAGSVTSAPAVLTVLPPGTNTFAGVLAGWDVSGQSAFGISPMPPTTNAASVTVIGLTRGAGVATSQTAANRGWGGNGFDAANAAAAVLNQDVATFALSPIPGYALSLSSISRFDYRRSGTGPPHGVLQYQVGADAFVDLTTLSYTSTSSSGASLAAIDLSGIPSLQNLGPGTNVTFRIVNYGGASGGTWYVFDAAGSSAPDLAISGTLAPLPPPPPTPATLVNPVSSAGQFQFALTGQTGAVYVIESTTNLAGGEWTPALTNTAPFIYLDTNATAAPLRLYRGRAQP